MASNLAARIEALEARTLAEAKPVTTPDLFAGSFPAQMDFVRDDADLMYAFCTRRAAKSYSGGLKAFYTAMKVPKASVLIAGLHRDEVKRVWWEPILRDMEDRFRVPGLKFNETELSVRFPNRTKIYLLGMDADEKQKRKALGQKYPLVIIDEAQDWATDLNELVFHVLKPTVADYNGQICLLGTPGLVAKGLFYDVTTGKEPGWKGHEWTTYDNTTRDKPGGLTMAEKWHIEIQKLKKAKPGVEETPWFRRNYLRQWVVEEELKVYRYQPGRNDFTDLPTHRRGEWRYVLGCDLGSNDAATHVVCAYHQFDKALYIIEAHSESGLDITDVANRAKALGQRYDFDAWVVDGANKQAVEEMRRRHEIPWVAADKTGKMDFIDLMNADFIAGNIKLRTEGCKPLVDEYKDLVINEKLFKEKGRREEHPACDNHCADATLYAWRHCYQYLSEPAPVEKSEDDRLEEEAEKRYLEAHQSAGFEVEGVGDSSKWEWFYR